MTRANTSPSTVETVRRDGTIENTLHDAPDDSSAQAWLDRLDALLAEHRVCADDAALSGLRAAVERQSAELARLQSAERSKAAPAKKQTVSLLAEVEQQRIALEKHCEDLKSSQSSLLKTHMANIQQSEMLRAHISRLSQLYMADSIESRYEKLLKTVAEVDSENKMLRMRLERYEGDEEEDNDATHDYLALQDSIDTHGTHSAHNTGDLLDSLRLQLHNMSRQVARLRRELRTANMLRLSETDKAKKANIQLSEKDQECYRLRAEFARLRVGSNKG